jgi:hypothetical protein
MCQGKADRVGHACSWMMNFCPSVGLNALRALVSLVWTSASPIVGTVPQRDHRCLDSARCERTSALSSLDMSPPTVTDKQYILLHKHRQCRYVLLPCYLDILRAGVRLATDPR